VILRGWMEAQEQAAARARVLANEVVWRGGCPRFRGDRGGFRLSPTNISRGVWRHPATPGA